MDIILFGQEIHMSGAALVWLTAIITLYKAYKFYIVNMFYDEYVEDGSE